MYRFRDVDLDLDVDADMDNPAQSKALQMQYLGDGAPLVSHSRPRPGSGRVLIEFRDRYQLHADTRILAVRAAGYLMMGISVPTWRSIIAPIVASTWRKRAATRAPICVLYSV
jgi:hypothetical protein